MNEQCPGCGGTSFAIARNMIGTRKCHCGATWLPIPKKEKELLAEIEALRMKLAACGVAAMCNTAESKLERIGKDNPYWSASYGDVCDAVDREMKLREENKQLRDKLGIAVSVLDWISRNCPDTAMVCLESVHALSKIRDGVKSEVI